MIYIIPYPETMYINYYPNRRDIITYPKSMYIIPDQKMNVHNRPVLEMNVYFSYLK